MGVNMIYITAHPKEGVVKYHQSDIFSMLSALKPAAFDVSGVKQAFATGSVSAEELAKIKQK